MPPGHATISRTGRLIDATTLEANAALRSIVRRDFGRRYQELLARLAKESAPTREQFAKLDRKRPQKGSNEEWMNPHHPEARIAEDERRADALGAQGRACGGILDGRGGGGDGGSGSRRKVCESLPVS